MFSRALPLLLTLYALALTPNHTRAFSLIGPFADWMQPTNGFRYEDDIGGPMNLGEEYRWNVPVLTYAFDESFLTYFGSNGVAAVEQAIQILNALPPVSQLEPTNYPTEYLGWNWSAQALNLTDLKSKTLATLLEHLGLTHATRHVFGVRDFAFTNGTLIAQTVQRNFDPFNFAPTNRVNRSAYDYVLQASTNGPAISVTAEEILTNLYEAFAFDSAVAGHPTPAGMFHPGLTRDDVGGLRYLLRTNNSNLEILLPGVHGVGPSAGNFVNQAMRSGVDKITFIRRDYDGLIGQFFTPYTNQFTDYYISNHTIVAQQLERVITEPDIVFCAGNGNQGIVTNTEIFRTGTSNWWSSSVFPGVSGPGVMRPPIRLMYSEPVETYITWDTMPNTAGGYGSAWGSFDGSTNAPVYYPRGGAAASDVIVRLHLMRNDTEIWNASWEIPRLPQEIILVLSSTNLVNWSFHSLFNAGSKVEWFHHISDAQRYFKFAPTGP
jgi:hypothetical protein